MLAPHTTMCMGVESLTEENRGSATCGPKFPYGRDLCKVTPVILHGVVSPDGESDEGLTLDQRLKKVHAQRST